MDFNEILIFARVVQAGSFIGASRGLGIPKSTISRKVADLEARLGARLLQRTTRTIRLTDVGQMYYKHAARVLGEVEEAELAVSRMQDVPRGVLRVTVPLNFGHLGPVVASFLQRYPEVQVELLSADRVVDLIEEGYDVAIRTGALADSTLVARSLGSLKSVLVANPAYLRTHGTPMRPEDLERFDCVVFGAGPDRGRWHLVRDAVKRRVKVNARLVVNDFEFVEQAARDGIGIAVLPLFRCKSALQEHQLQQVLPDWCIPEIPLHAVYPSTRYLSPKVKAFVDYVRDELTGWT